MVLLWNEKLIRKRNVLNVTYNTLMKNCDIGLSTVMISNNIKKDIKFADLNSRGFRLY